MYWRIWDTLASWDVSVFIEANPSLVEVRLDPRASFSNSSNSMVASAVL
jgi:hypothetical protein